MIVAVAPSSPCWQCWEGVNLSVFGFCLLGFPPMARKLRQLHCNDWFNGHVLVDLLLVDLLLMLKRLGSVTIGMRALLGRRGLHHPRVSIHVTIAPIRVTRTTAPKTIPKSRFPSFVRLALVFPKPSIHAAILSHPRRLRGR